VTVDELARAYVTRVSKRRRVLEVLLEEEAYSAVVRETQELVELGFALWALTHPNGMM
jgi:hypothetical protein